jgi:mannose-6-phosphate isomerase-like protein (cupin superfamily)
LKAGIERQFAGNESRVADPCERSVSDNHPSVNVIDNPVTGETIAFLDPPGGADGMRLRIEMRTRPGAAPAAAHIHPHQDEHFEIIEGLFEFEVGRERFTVGDGDNVTVPEGKPHMWRNIGDAAGLMVIEWTPAGKTQEFFESLFALARDGHVGKNGLPSLLRMSLMAPAYDMWAAKPPILIQKAGAALLGPLARLKGLRSAYP